MLLKYRLIREWAILEPAPKANPSFTVCIRDGCCTWIEGGRGLGVVTAEEVRRGIL